MINFSKVFNRLKKKGVAGNYIGSGLFKAAVSILSGFIIMRWIIPEQLGVWQSFTVFTGYIQIMTLGVTSGLNRELPYWLGKGDEDKGIERLRTAGYFSTALSIGLLIIIVILSAILYLTRIFTLDYSLMLLFAFSMAALTIQTNFLGATFRSVSSFGKLSNIQWINSIMYFVLLPLIYFFDIWGYIAYQVGLALYLYLAFQYFRPYKVGYAFQWSHLKELIIVGFPMYFWGYLSQMSRSIPRLVLVMLGTPLMVGLYAPSGSINAAMLNLPNYTNRYVFPKMSYKYGQTQSKMAVYQYTIKAAKFLFGIMLLGSIALTIIIPYVFPKLFPKYVPGIPAAQITVFSGLFYSINALISNAFNSIKSFEYFKYIIIFRLFYITVFTFLAYLYFEELLIAVSIGSVLAEIFNLFNYIYFLKKACLK